jgi:hypothetical protein
LGVTGSAFWYRSAVSIDLGRRLIAAGLVSPDEVEAALFFSVARGVPFARVLIDRGAISERTLEDELDRVGGLGLRQVTGAAGLVARLPRSMCRRLAALPTRVDPSTGAVDVATADPLDPHVAAEFSFHLGAPVRVLRAPIAAVEEAIRRLELDDAQEAPRPRARRMTPASPYGSPQSSIPPPVLDEAPIPLVRKATPAEATPARAGGTLVPPAGAPPAARVAAPATPATGNRRANATTAPYPGADWPVPGKAAVQIPEPPGTLPYPVATPQDEGKRITPPYGTPVYNPTPSPPREYEPPEQPAYRAPPPPAPPPPSPAPPPPATGPAPKPTLVSAQWAASGDGGASAPVRDAGRGSGSRPAMGEVLYPAAIQPRPPGSLRSALPDEEAEDEDPVPLEPKIIRMPEIGPVLDALARTTSRDEVLRETLRGMRLVARRLAVFAVRRDGFQGWASNVDMADADALREVKIPLDLPSVLATATATAIYLGPIPVTPAHEALLRVMERASPDVASVAVRVAGRPVMVLLCDELDDTLFGTRFLTELARGAGDALTRLLAR